MQGPRPGEADLRRFRHLAQLTALVTLVLIVVGGIVRVSESGLGCGPAGSGTHGWPLCGGQVIPLIDVDANRIVEFTHRVLAGVVGVMIALLAWQAYRRLRALRWPLRGSLAGVALVLVQAVLGGLTVENNLKAELVAAHLGLAMLFLGLLLWLVARARQEAGSDGPAVLAASPIPGLRPFALVAVVLLLGAIVAGGYVAGTEEEGAEGAVAAGAHLACGEAFPTCLDNRILPFGVSRLTDIHLTHRVLVYLASAAILLLIGLALRRGARSPLLPLTGALLAAQLLLGALNVWLGKHATLVVAHLTAATLLWGALLLIAFTLAYAPARSGAGGRAARAERPEPTAVAA